MVFVFSSNATLTVLVNTFGTGHLMYSLNDGPWQDSNIFENLAPGDYDIKVVDIEGCTFLTINAQIIGYPKFFTPNGDSFNDFWNIIALPNPTKASTTIYDRYGKLIHQINSINPGWDGTFNGSLVPFGSYTYQFYYKLPNTSERHISTGSFSIVK
jgi:gliding motility-associated-like protein